MKPCGVVTGRVAVLDRPDVDTDQIIPKQFLKRIERTGFGEFLFYDWRYDENGDERPGFELNRPEYAGAQDPARRAQLRVRVVARARRLGAAGLRLRGDRRALVRRHLPHERRQDRPARGELPEDEVKRLMERVDRQRLRADGRPRALTSWSTPTGESCPFEFDQATRHRLLHGLDDIALTLEHEDEIAAYETAHGIA